jgi:hypothetical protein
VHSELPGLIAAGGDDATLSAAPHDQRLSPKCRVMQDFNLHEKCIEVEMSDIAQWYGLPHDGHRLG